MADTRTPSVAIYEPLYLPGQTSSEPAFLPLLVRDSSRADWREFGIIVDMYRQGLHLQNDFTGLFSPKFALKTGLRGEVFVDFVRANADADVCLVNPFPQLAYISYNVWMQGEVAHVGLTERADWLLEAAGIPWRTESLGRHGPDILSYGNFWVGTPSFWDKYVGGVLVPIAEHLELYSETPLSRALLETTSHTDRTPFLPFVVERLLSSFLGVQSGIHVAAQQIDPLAGALLDFEREIVRFMRERVDAADRAKKFPDDLVALMGMNCRLFQMYSFEYWATHPHPHSGKPMLPSAEYLLSTRQGRS